MAKGLRSKVKLRFRNAKRAKLDKSVTLEKQNRCHNILKCIQEGTYVDVKKPLNAFLHPDEVDAVIPQRQVQPKIDFRSAYVSESATAFIGNRRKISKKDRLDLLLKREKLLRGTYWPYEKAVQKMEVVE
eukprot:GHVL01014507.1.p1 GENE.GHVL01014507.1~~GHVL01014507.1.p1  ORF type:complete len:130 (+),score=25.43 GHVL01014507.1:95-484(+)